MGKLRSELIGKVLSNLGLGNDTPAAEDVSKVDKVIDDVVDSLSARNIYTISDPGRIGPTGGDIEPRVFQQLAAIVSAFAAQEFDDTDLKYTVARASAEDELRVIAAPSRTRRHLRVDPALTAWSRGGYRGGY